MALLRFAFAMLLMMLSIPLVTIALAALLLYVWPPLFWAALGVVILYGTWSAFALKRAPRVRLKGLSPKAEELLSTYNHAWFAPGATKLISGILGTWQIICVIAGIYFAFQTNWISVGILVGALSFLSLLSGVINPMAYIRHRQLDSEHDEILQAYVEKRFEHSV